MSIDSVKSISIFNCSTILLLIILMLSGISASLQGEIINRTVPCDWQQDNVFFYIHAYSDDDKIDNYSIPFIFLKKDLRLCISLRMSVWPLFIKIKVWNDTGLIIDCRDDHFYLVTENFTGLITHRRDLLGYVWNIFGYCNVIKIIKGY